MAVCAHTVLAVALACRRRRRMQAAATQRVPRCGGKGPSVFPCCRCGRYAPCSGRGGRVRRVPRWLPGAADFAKHVCFLIFFGSSPPCVVDLGDNHRLATLPGEEGVDGLLKLSDPQILAGRIACISLLTTGSGLLSLAASTPGSPLGDSPITFGWNRKLYRYSVPATPRYSVPPTPIS